VDKRWWRSREVRSDLRVRSHCWPDGVIPCEIAGTVLFPAESDASFSTADVPGDGGYKRGLGPEGHSAQNTRSRGLPLGRRIDKSQIEFSNFPAMLLSNRRYALPSGTRSTSYPWVVAFRRCTEYLIADTS